MSNIQPAYQPGQKLVQDDFKKAFNYAFTHYDQDKDGRLNIKEFKTMYNSLNVMKNKTWNFEITPQIMDYLFKKHDRNGDGYVEHADLFQALGGAYYA